MALLAYSMPFHTVNLVSFVGRSLCGILIVFVGPAPLMLQNYVMTVVSFQSEKAASCSDIHTLKDEWINERVLQHAAVNPFPMVNYWHFWMTVLLAHLASTIGLSLCPERHHITS